MSTKLSQKFSAVTSFNLKTQSYGIDMLESYLNSGLMNVFICLFRGNTNLDDKKVKNKINILNFDEEIPEYRSLPQNIFIKIMTKTIDLMLKLAHKIFAIQKQFLYVRHNI